LLFAGKVLSGAKDCNKTLLYHGIPNGATLILTVDLYDPTQAGVELDLCFVVDCTASMGSYIRSAQENIKRIIDEITASESAQINFALVSQRLLFSFF